MLYGADHQYPSVSLALLFVKYVRIACIIGYEVLLSSTVSMHIVLIKVG
jgi:hypothetical protein